MKKNKAKKKAKKKDLIVVTIKSDDCDTTTLESIKKELKGVWKKHKVAVFGIGTEESLDIGIFRR
jgi:hypothetical protein